jgi:hypothetical protein
MDPFERAQSGLVAADKNVNAIVDDLGKKIAEEGVPTDLVIRLTSLQIQLAEAWTRLAQYQREQRP